MCSLHILKPRLLLSVGSTRPSVASMQQSSQTTTSQYVASTHPTPPGSRAILVLPQQFPKAYHRHHPLTRAAGIRGQVSLGFPPRWTWYTKEYYPYDSGSQFQGQVRHLERVIHICHTITSWESSFPSQSSPTGRLHHQTHLHPGDHIITSIMWTPFHSRHGSPYPMEFNSLFTIGGTQFP